MEARENRRMGEQTEFTEKLKAGIRTRTKKGGMKKRSKRE